MKIKDRIKTVGFWTGIVGAIFLMLGAFGVEIGDQTATAVINSVCSLLVLLGIVKVPAGSVSDTIAEEENKDDINDA